MPATEADILAAWSAAWDVTSVLAALVPGGLHHDRTAQAQDGQALASTYANVEIEAAEPEFASSTDYLQTFNVTLTLYGRVGIDGVSEALAQIESLYNPAAGAAVPTALPTPSGCTKLLRVRPAVGSWKLAPERIEGSDVVSGRRAWSVEVQQTRS